MSTHSLRRTGRRYYLNDSTSPFSSAAGVAVADWVSRVVAEGGAVPSDNTKNTLATFHQTLATDGILNKMVNINCVVPDSLQAALTPFIATHGSGSAGEGNSWANTNFTNSDLTIFGLKGDGTTKYLRTGIQISNIFSVNSMGITIYNTFSNTEAVNSGLDAGVLDFSSRIFRFAVNSADTCVFECYDTSTTRIAVATPLVGGLGYTSGNRTTSITSSVYVASSVVTHGLIGINTGSLSASPPLLELPIYCLNTTTTFNTISPKQFSFIGIHFGLTQNESLAFYNAIQSMRISLGGGYI